MLRLQLILLLVSIHFASQCDSGVPSIDRDLTAPVQTNQTAYTISDDGTIVSVSIPFVYTNQGRGDKYIITCDVPVEYSLEIERPSGWSIVWSPVLQSCLSWPPRRLKTGESMVDTVQIYGVLRANSFPTAEWASEVPGVFRLKFHSVVSEIDEGDGSWGPDVSEGERVSNPFTLEKR